MRRSEMQALGQLAGEALSAGGSLIEQMHAGIAERAFGRSPASAPARIIHDGVSRAVYAGVRGGLRALTQGGAQIAAQRAAREAESMSARPRAALALGVLAGLYGDRVAERVPELALAMEIRRGGRTVPPNAEAVRRAFPDAAPRLAVFVHGLCETDLAWRLGAPRPPYGERLQAELRYTPVYLRYNTGLHISDNGRSLARLLTDLVCAWPVEVREIILVGHSMGGLVARSACHYAEHGGLAVAAHIRHVFCLGTPHLGADLERGANALAWASQRLPETSAFGAFLNARSAGIKDLRYGACVEEDWADCDPDEFLRDRCREVPFLAGAHYYFIGTALSPAPLGRVLGDLLVRIPSASGRGTGRGRRIPFEVECGHELTGLHHFDLLNHEAVYEQLRVWLSGAEHSPLALLASG